MDEAEVAVGGFVVARCKAPGVFELVEASLDHIAQGIDGGIDGNLDKAVPLGRDDRNAATLLHIFTNEVSVLSLVSTLIKKAAIASKAIT